MSHISTQGVGPKRQPQPLQLPVAGHRPVTSPPSDLGETRSCAAARHRVRAAGISKTSTPSCPVDKVRFVMPFVPLPDGANCVRSGRTAALPARARSSKANLLARPAAG
jgi:hypothetical protein